MEVEFRMKYVSYGICSAPTRLRRDPPLDVLVYCRLAEQVKVVHVMTDPRPGFSK
jgi:hypothetical protein